jgi:hypothetical protein
MTTTIMHGFSACASEYDGGWYGGVLVLDGRDDEFLPVPKDLTYGQRLAYARHWSALTSSPRRELVLVRLAGEAMDVHSIASAERLEGPVAPRERVQSPVLVWIERRSLQWHLMLWENDEVRSVLARPAVLRCPQAAMTESGLVFAFESDTGPFSTQVEAVDINGLLLWKTAGRSPVLRAAGTGFVLGTEQYTPNEVTLRIEYFAGSVGVPAHTVELREEDYLLNADMAWNESAQSLVVAAENTPRFGYSNQIGLHRTIPVWFWQPGSSPVAAGPLPIEQRAFGSIGNENITPIKPSVLIEDSQPVILFKQHRFAAFRAFGWDLFWCRRSGDTWTEPARISPSTMVSDAGFGLVRHNDGYVGLFPAHENEGGKESKRSTNHRVDMVHIDREQRLPRFEIPEGKKRPYRLPPACKDAAPEPMPLAKQYEGRQLIWGDLHIHSIYSKCVSAVDGDPRENIRFARDVLGCRVFAITEHTRHTVGIESTWLYDQLESTAGRDNVILYAAEPGVRNTRHMNWYCRNRDMFEKLERIIIAQDQNYPEILRHLREELPHDAVFVMRHVHGTPIQDAQISQHFDPHFETAMEAMQGRGNAMLGVVEKSPIFPNSFLDAGCKIGLVGGTDHFREWAPNHFCLTGFWVKEVSADGVWEAIRNRYTIAMSDSRVALMTICKGIPMGETVNLDKHEAMRVIVHASCGHRIRRLTMMRDGVLLPWVSVDANRASVELVDEQVTPGKHWYVVTAEVDTGHGGGHTGICHASPNFVWKQT